MLNPLEGDSRVKWFRHRTLAVVEDVDGDIGEVMLSSVVETCNRVRRTDLSVSILAKHRSHCAVQIRGAHTYGSLIRVYGALHDMKNVWVTWREMLDNGIAPSSITLGSVGTGGCMVKSELEVRLHLLRFCIRMRPYYWRVRLMYRLAPLADVAATAPECLSILLLTSRKIDKRLI